MPRKKQGKLIDKSATVQSDGQVGEFSVPGAQVIEVEEESWFSIIFGWVRGIIVFLLLTLAVLAALYSGLAATMLVYSDTGEGEYNLVLRGAWSDTGGEPPLGTQVAISSTTEAPQNWWDWIVTGWIGIPSPATVEVVSTNFDRLYVERTTDGGPITVVVLDNETIRGTLVPSTVLPLTKYDTAPFETNYQLDNEYLVRCVVGACEPGTYSVVSKTQIFGEVR